MGSLFMLSETPMRFALTGRTRRSKAVSFPRAASGFSTASLAGRPSMAANLPDHDRCHLS